jgi:3-methyl-2-oxobutanoate hydroxymethyltransferase
MKRFTTENFRKSKESGEKITMLTAYDYPIAKLMDEAGVDSILVGDSLGMVVLGYEDTTKVTIEDMIHHCKAVSRGAKNAMIVGDMPFMSYGVSLSDTLKNAGRLISEGGCHAIKLEGGEAMAESVKAIVALGIPVIGHIGYTPQSINLFGGHKAQGKTIETAEKIIKDALALQDAGAFAIVLECIPFKLAKLVTERLHISTIGIGAGSNCDGQVLVSHDMLGMYPEINRKHSKTYGNISEVIKKSVSDYINEVKNKGFPTENNSFIIDDEIMKKLDK